MSRRVSVTKSWDWSGVERSAVLEVGRFSSIPPLSWYLRVRVTVEHSRAVGRAPLFVHVELGRNRIVTLNLRVPPVRFVEDQP